ncbi:hypothetical protein HMI01_19430 [Halolactibacillus miurensis]|uniref:Spore coat protein Z n=1 Tax=Halolactibacillus miurensis TaxID=306541 RepID=A0A1I6S2K5_9BACI|nr:CotY/CotZ family spore coat protein [Halolactibacillus miurensis]GEM04955.1 hypothetical protein HMI01_19430 [Halolactibacillus miurensis]SFS71191.1 spore coat protein Z [Halolactibacillus miurensis]
MACGTSFEGDHCVTNVLREIAEAQNKLGPCHCDSSCEQSISDLFGSHQEGCHYDTVPVLLYCRNCQPFKGYGAKPKKIEHVFSSYYFRVKSVDRHCCILELLRDQCQEALDPVSPVEQKTEKLRGTGVCITVDPECFCHITCLPAIRAL